MKYLPLSANSNNKERIIFVTGWIILSILLFASGYYIGSKSNSDNDILTVMIFPSTKCVNTGIDTICTR